MNYYFQALKKSIITHGRAHRKEFWIFLFFNTLASLIFSIIDIALDLQIFSENFYDKSIFIFHFPGAIVSLNRMGILSTLYFLIILLPLISLSIRRLHDTNKDGWWLLINLLPILGNILFLVFLLLPGDAGENKYGKNTSDKNI